MQSATRYCASLADLDFHALYDRPKEVALKNWHLGFTAFGGPPVHFQILHKKFVEKHKWIDEQLYQEIFALSQALPGPASTKMLFCINYIHGGLLAGLCGFLLWCLPGAIGMYGLSLGVSRIGDSLPPPVYALLSGLNAATVGIIALAAVQLAEKAITDKVTRVLVVFSGIAGMLYTALWFFPVLMLFSGLVTVFWDFKWLHRFFRPLGRRRREEVTEAEEGVGESRVRPESLREGAQVYPQTGENSGAVSLRRIAAVDGNDTGSTVVVDETTDDFNETSSRTSARIVPQNIQLKLITWKVGICIITAFLASFATIMIIRGVLKSPPRGASLFGNLYLAGTIIFGGGPVVIPLLREYIVAEGWVSPRDFLLGLALIQSFPGPNFNFAVYLGSLATAGTSLSSAVGALIGFLGIFTPGIIIVIGVMGLWNVLRSRRWLLCFLRGVNAGAVGLVFTAVYKLWQIGFVDADHQSGSPLGRDPWWVSITAISFVAGRWFGLSAPFAILLGGSLGTAWYGVVKA